MSRYRAEWPVTPDQRYRVARGRLWRLRNPDLPQEEAERMVRELLSTRRMIVARTADSVTVQKARGRIESLKHALGLCGPVWWSDGGRDLTRERVSNSRYAEWYAGLKAR